MRRELSEIKVQKNCTVRIKKFSGRRNPCVLFLGDNEMLLRKPYRCGSFDFLLYDADTRPAALVVYAWASLLILSAKPNGLVERSSNRINIKFYFVNPFVFI